MKLLQWLFPPMPEIGSVWRWRDGTRARYRVVDVDGPFIRYVLCTPHRDGLPDVGQPCQIAHGARMFRMRFIPA